MEEFDLLITSVPEMENDLPSPAPFYLKSFLEENGFKVKAIDGNRYKTVDKLENEIRKYKFRNLGISVFSFMHKDFAIKLSKRFKNIRKVFGGGGVYLGWHNEFDKNLGDYIVGEGEYSLLEWLKGNDYPGINGIPPKQIKNISILPNPDYSDIDTSLYRKLSITGSRGCVRNCSFCNVRDNWKNFTYIEGEQLAKNMIKLKEDTGIYRLAFSDSLVNGSIREFKKMCKHLAIYNRSLEKGIKRIRWFGQFIIRNKKRITEEDFDLIKDSGCGHLSIGIESGSEKVRLSMNKNFTNEDIYWNFDNLIKREIEFKILLIVGYPTETKEDFEETIELLKKYSYASNIIAVTPHLFLPFENKNLGVDRNDFKWKNENSDYIERLRRELKVFETMENGGYILEKHALSKLEKAKEALKKRGKL